MKRVKGLIAIIFAVCFFSIAQAQPVIVDNACTDLNQVPQQWIETAKSNLRISYGHTSHGSQLVTGIDVISNFKDAPYNFTYSSGYSAGIFLNDYEPSGDLGNPNRTTWAQQTRDFLNQPGNDRNVVMWSWCGQVDGTEAEIDTYLTLMSQLEQDFPDVKFVYMTGHLNGTGASDNVNRRNEQIRGYARSHDKILFDFADIESYDPDRLTNYMELYANDNCDYKGGHNWAEEWINANPSSELAQIAGQCGSCAHSQNLNCVLKGSAFWWLMARIAGWDGGIAPNYTLTVTKKGTGKGSVQATGLTCRASTCRGDYSVGEIATITARAQTGSYFDRWTGCDVADGEVCVMTMNGDKNVSVSFKQLSAISIKPKSLNFGKVKKDSLSEAKIITTKNSGLEDILVNSVEITGIHREEFDMVNGCTLPLSPQASCDISITVTAKDYGKREALLQILSHPKAPVVGVKLLAKAEKPKISASPRRLNFGTVQIGSSSPTKNITIKNNGASDLVFSSIVIVDDPDNEFIYSTLCSTLKKGETCNIEVTFEPFVMGSRNAQIEIQSNDPANSPLLLMLKGKGQ